MPTSKISVPKFFRYAVALLGVVLVLLSGALWWVRHDVDDTPILLFLHQSRGSNITLYQANANGNHLRRLSPPTLVVTQALWTPDGGWITFVADNPRPDIYRVRLVGGKLQRLTHTFEAESSLVWSPDGKTLYFAAQDYSGVYPMELTLDDLATQRFVEDNAFGWQVVVSPDGQWVAYDRKGSVGNTIHVWTRDGSMMRDVGSGFEVTNLSEPSWNGQWLTFVMTTDANASLYQLDSSDPTSRPMLLYSTIGFIREVEWSPDRKHVALSELTPSGLPNLHLMRLNAVGDSLENVQVLDAYYGGAAWTADGQWVAYVQGGTGGFNIYRARADGTDVQRVTNLHGSEYDPQWATPIQLAWSEEWLILGGMGIIGLSILGKRKQYKTHDRYTLT